jgi:hypothetical protein
LLVSDRIKLRHLWLGEPAPGVGNNYDADGDQAGGDEPFPRAPGGHRTLDYACVPWQMPQLPQRRNVDKIAARTGHSTTGLTNFDRQFVTAAALEEVFGHRKSA